MIAIVLSKGQSGPMHRWFRGDRFGGVPETSVDRRVCRGEEGPEGGSRGIERRAVEGRSGWWMRGNRSPLRMHDQRPRGLWDPGRALPGVPYGEVGGRSGEGVPHRALGPPGRCLSDRGRDDCSVVRRLMRDRRTTITRVSARGRRSPQLSADVEVVAVHGELAGVALVQAADPIHVAPDHSASSEVGVGLQQRAPESRHRTALRRNLHIPEGPVGDEESDVTDGRLEIAPSRRDVTMETAAIRVEEIREGGSDRGMEVTVNVEVGAAIRSLAIVLHIV